MLFNMFSRSKIFCALLLVAIYAGSCTPDTVSVETLLTEMIDRDNIAKLKNYRCLQASSYDRHSVAKEEDGWFANSDRSWFIREETNAGRREFVMMEDTGPGAVVRFWMTFSPESANGVLRFYLDGSCVPSIEGPVIDILGGDAIAPYPLSVVISDPEVIFKHSYNLYLPIPYKSGCKITFEGEYIDADNPGAVNAKQGKIYYNIEYRSYPETTKIKSFDQSDLEKNATLIDETCQILLSKETGVSNLENSVNIDCSIPAGESKQFCIDGEGAVQCLSMRLVADNHSDALRRVVMEISFDGKNTVWAPVGDFFGIGYKYKTSSSWFTETDSNGIMHSFWPMPFQKSCTICLHNFSSEEVMVTDAKVECVRWKWDSNSLYFVADWHQYVDIQVGKGYERDLEFLRTKGKGVYVGTCICLRNGAANWWGEGDEKIFVDGESFPSHFGTGTEDYFGYAWSSPVIFEHPMIAQPSGEGNLEPGFTCNTRWRILDAIPFSENFVFDMEIIHTENCIMDYSVLNYWYADPETEIPGYHTIPSSPAE